MTPPAPMAPATTVVTPPPSGATPLKPVLATPAAPSEVNAKSGTTVVKTPPPKETARITVKPNLPPQPVRAGSNFPQAKPAAPGAVPVAAAVAGAAVGAAMVAKAVAKPTAKPATTIVKAGGAKVAATPVKAVASSAPTPSVAAAPSAYQEDVSTTLTTGLAGALAVLTWGTAGVLFASLMAWI
jgi:hypothetical protein